MKTKGEQYVLKTDQPVVKPDGEFHTDKFLGRKGEVVEVVKNGSDGLVMVKKTNSDLTYWTASDNLKEYTGRFGSTRFGSTRFGR